MTDNTLEEQVKDFAGTALKFGLFGFIFAGAYVANIPIQICRGGYFLASGKGIKVSTYDFGSVDCDGGIFPIPIIEKKYQK